MSRGDGVSRRGRVNGCGRVVQGVNLTRERGAGESAFNDERADVEFGRDGILSPELIVLDDERNGFLVGE